MKYKKSSRLLDLDHDLPTSSADIFALRRARSDRITHFKTYLEFLACFPLPSTSALGARKGPAGPKPFEL
jgi:hypothetical protein